MQNETAQSVRIVPANSHFWRNRNVLKVHHGQATSAGAAGLPIDKTGLGFDDEEAFDSYDQLQIVFKRTEGLCQVPRRYRKDTLIPPIDCERFAKTWLKAIGARRRDRKRLKAIQEAVSKEVYNGG
jgi:hypothetical protein